MSARRREFGLLSTFLSVTVVALGAARSAHASDADPFDAKPASTGSDEADQSESPAHPPAATPAVPAVSSSPGLVEELPASAYPEPYTRGLYGGSLWLAMQGLQWPYTPRTGIGVSGYGWLDNDYKLTRIGDPGQSPHTTKLFQQGRFLLRVTPTYSSGAWFAQAQAELVANKDQLDTQPNVVDADDVWVRTGDWQKWDVTLGRFEAFEVYHLGMGLDINTDERIGAYDGSHSPPALYGATYLFYRPSGPGNIALHLFPTPYLRLEILAQWGNDNTLNYVGGRPAVVFDVGWLKIKAAAEYQWGTPQDPAPTFRNEHRNRGVAGSVQLVFAPWVELGVNAGAAAFDVYDANSNGLDTTLSGKEVSLGGFLNARLLPDLLLGLGGNYASQHNLHLNAGTYDVSTNTQMFLAVQYLFYKQLFVKLVGGYAKSHFDYSFNQMNPYDDDMYSVRLRVMYLF
jgi:hypothetical protein